MVESKQHIAALTKKDPSGITIEIEGAWIIKHNIDELWYQLRSIDQWQYNPKGVANKKITPAFRDYITIGQAVSLGILNSQ